MGKVYKVGLIGCGHIAETYFRAHKYFNNFKIIKCADINKFAAQKCAKTYKISSASVNELLKDKEIQVILNLTIPNANYLIAKKAGVNFLAYRCDISSKKIFIDKKLKIIDD